MSETYLSLFYQFHILHWSNVPNLIQNLKYMYMYIISSLFLWCLCPELFWFKMHKVAVVETN